MIINNAAYGFIVQLPDEDETAFAKLDFWKTIQKSLERSTYEDLSDRWNLDINYSFDADIYDKIGVITIEKFEEDGDLLIYYLPSSRYEEYHFDSHILMRTPTNEELSAVKLCHQLISKKYITSEIGIILNKDY